MLWTLIKRIKCGVLYSVWTVERMPITLGKTELVFFEKTRLLKFRVLLDKKSCSSESTN